MESSQRLLIAEDDVTVARALARTLARRGFSVAIARSCAAAREFDERFDAAVLDLDLPDGNGVDLARELMSVGRIPSVVFFTGSNDPALLARARRVGPVIMKSGGASEILALLTHDLSASEAPQSRTAPSPKARRIRGSSNAVPASSHSESSSGSLRKSRAR